LPDKGDDRLLVVDGGEEGGRRGVHYRQMAEFPRKHERKSASHELTHR
jgi:hypothetical protein